MDIKAPAQVNISMMYRDAANYKTNERYTLTNKTGLIDDIIEKKLQSLLDESIIPAYYSLPTLSPLDNEFIASKDDDHPFCEIVDFDFRPVDKNHIEVDISEVIAAIDDPQIVEGKQKTMKNLAINSLQEQLKKLLEN